LQFPKAETTMPKRAGKRPGQLPRGDQSRILSHLDAHPNEDMVVKVRNGKIRKIYSARSNAKMQASARAHKPWLMRKKTKRCPDPLGAVPGTVLAAITRQTIYEETDH
jgi:hypothetical protein